MTTAPLPPSLPPEGETDAELLRLILDFVDSAPARHRQGTWIEGLVQVARENPQARGGDLLALLRDPVSLEVCGTAGCFAGWASLAAGWRQSRAFHADVEDPTTGETVSMRVAARRSLGLTPLQAAVLFDGGNTREDLREMVEEIIADPATELPSWWDSTDVYPDDYRPNGECYAEWL